MKISPKLQRQVFSPTVPSNSEHYQRQTRFNRIKEPNLLAIASTSGDIAILSYPALDSVYSAIAEGDVYDLDFSPADNDMVSTLLHFLIYLRLFISQPNPCTSYHSVTQNESGYRIKSNYRSCNLRPSSPGFSILRHHLWYIDVPGFWVQRPFYVLWTIEVLKGHTFNYASLTSNKVGDS